MPYLYMTVIIHADIEHEVTDMACHIQGQVIKTEANHTAAFEILVNLGVVNHSPAAKISPS